MALPPRLLCQINGNFSVVDPRHEGVNEFDIISYVWGPEVEAYDCAIPGVNWGIKLGRDKLNDIKRLMVSAPMRYLWVDAVCINQTDPTEKSIELSKMYEYYRSASFCHILIDLPKVWNPQEIVDHLRFLDHVLLSTRGSGIASQAVGLTQKMAADLAWWANQNWTFRMNKRKVQAAAIDTEVLNCYSTCIGHVRSVFRNLYFSRVWTFQEMLLGNNITMWGINPERISCLGALGIWMDLAIESEDKAVKLRDWITADRVLNPGGVNAILRIIKEDHESLINLQAQVKGINSARTDIINGGPRWWQQNFKGVSNIFSAVSITPRKCQVNADVFKGLLGVFSGLFSPEEITREMSGDDMGSILLAFFKQLSTKTGYAWTKLAISSRERGEWDWIPVVESYSGLMTTDCFAGVVPLGRLKKNGQAKAWAMTGIDGVPKKYMKIKLIRGRPEFQFVFKGCNCGKDIKTGVFKSEPIPTYDRPRNVGKDETGTILVQCATILGSVMDPGGNVVEYRRRFLRNLQPYWEPNDPNAKLVEWIDRCVSGTNWEHPNSMWYRSHNESMNYRMVDLDSCGTRLANTGTASISCEVCVTACGCSIVAPFSWIFEAITAVEGSFLGKTAVSLDKDNRITLTDGLGLVQVGDIGRTFKLVAFGGDVDSHKTYASGCKSTKRGREVLANVRWPTGRALVREEFTHGITDMARDYGYVENEGAGNLLVCRNQAWGPYRIIGVCIDDYIPSKKRAGEVNIR
ncbi:hypothetical protein GJ744_004387 [Endocarpon pusillum]|uniref:Heterokaryon incompatibility domain-containing protein n=1 Tax=Endocarpon pusillum TaxID=364733 RepID=A0A8H7E9D0_9EURO|nr:hypothetical protein GJ744_004387 [Endocarpon pusillum]